jgi:hypothetical protein
MWIAGLCKGLRGPRTPSTLRMNVTMREGMRVEVVYLHPVIPRQALHDIKQVRASLMALNWRSRLQLDVQATAGKPSDP